MSTSLVVANAGPMARFAEVTGDPATPDLIVQRLAAGESLRDMARGWAIPYTRFLAWVAGNADLTEQCKRVCELAGVDLRFEGLEIIDGATPEDIAVAKERAQYRERLSRDLNRQLFGKHTQHTHTHTVDLGERLRRARERVIDQAPEAVTLGAATPSAVSPDRSPAPAVVEAPI